MDTTTDDPADVHQVATTRKWDAAVDLDFAPRRLHSAAQARVGELLVLTHPSSKHAITVDAVTAVLWGDWDGTVTLGEQASDVVDALGLDPDYAGTMVVKLAKVLALSGYLEEPRLDKALRSFPLYPEIASGSCLGRKFGLDEASFMTLAVGSPVDSILPTHMRVGVTDAEVFEWFRQSTSRWRATGSVDGALGDPSGLELLGARIHADEQSSPSGMRLRRKHRIYDHGGNLVFQSADRGVLASALGRIVTERAALSCGGTWLRVPAIVKEGAVVLVYPVLEDALFAGQRRLRDHGIRIHESPYVQLDESANHIVVDDNPMVYPDTDERELTPPGRHRVVGLVGPGRDQDPAEVVRGFSHTAVTWNQAHLDGVVALVDQVSFAGVSPRWSDSRVADHLADTLISALAGR